MSPSPAETNALPLAGVKVLDLGQIYQGPYATFLMAKAGADVVKIEPPGGEAARGRSDVNQGAFLPFEILNSNKRGITLNLKSPEGRQLFLDLVRDADVVLENFAPGVMDRLGIGWSVLREINPRLIYATGTGFGLTGPDRDRLAMDLTVQAVSGVISGTGMADGPPVKAGPAIADFAGGVHLYGAVMTALVGRATSGRGQLVEVSMQETIIPMLCSALGMLYSPNAAEVPPRTGNRHSGLAQAPYNVYKAKDGYVALIVIREPHWQSLLQIMGRGDLANDPRFFSNAERVKRMDETDALIEEWSTKRSVSEIYELALNNRIPCAPVRDLREVIHDPHLHQRGMLEWADHPLMGRTIIFNSPLRFHDTAPLKRTPSPRLGEHTVEVLKERLGLSEKAIQDLSAAGALQFAPGSIGGRPL